MSGVRARLGSALGAERIAELERRVGELEGQLAESQQLHHRFAELLDVVTELMVPLAQQAGGDAEATVRRYLDELGS